MQTDNRGDFCISVCQEHIQSAFHFKFEENTSKLTSRRKLVSASEQIGSAENEHSEGTMS